MKKINICFLCLSLLAINSNLFAQSPRIGVKAGLNASNLFINREDVDDENMRLGLHGGLFAQMMGEDAMVGLQTELLLSTKGASAQYNFLGASGRVNFNSLYLDVPLLLVVKLGDVVDLQAGGYGGFLLGASTSTKGDFGDEYQELDRDNFKKFDYGLTVGAAFNLDIISIGARYNYGLNPIANSDAAKLVLGDSKNSVAQVFIAINL